MGCVLTHWGRVTHIRVGNLTTIASDNGLSPGQRQVIIWTNAGILLIRTLRTNFSEILSTIHAFSFKTMHLKMSSAKWRSFCLSLNVLIWNLSGNFGRTVQYDMHAIVNLNTCTKENSKCLVAGGHFKSGVLEEYEVNWIKMVSFWHIEVEIGGWVLVVEVRCWGVLTSYYKIFRSLFLFIIIVKSLI